MILAGTRDWTFAGLDLDDLAGASLVRANVTWDGCFGGCPATCLQQTAFTVVCDGSYLVDPASSHMLVSKIKPCMSKYKHLYCETANGSLNQLSFI